MAEEPLSFMARLKRHHIFRVASVYAVAAYILIQAANAVFPDIGLSRADVRFIIAALALLFPVALVLGWMFIPPSKENPAKFSSWQHVRFRVGSVLALVIVVLVVLSGVYLWRANERYMKAEAVATTKAPSATPAPAAATAIPAKSIAVLPFENLSDEKANAYFADGMQDMILTKLADISDLKVIARTSTAGYASHPGDLKTIGKELGVATILEGSVQKAGNQVLINVQLIDANSDEHIWAEAYQRNLNNIFDVEGEVAQKVAAALDARLTQTESARLSAAPTQSPQAYDLFLRAEYYAQRGYSNYHSSQDFQAAIKNYNAAVQQDPNFVLAWARMSQIQSLMAWVSSPVYVLNRAQLAVQAEQAMQHAEALAPQSAETYLARGYYELYVATDVERALSAFQSAAEIEPQNAIAQYGIGTAYYHLGRFDDAVQAYQKSEVLDPRNENNLEQLAHAYMELRRYVQAEKVTKQALAVNPSSSTAIGDLLRVYLLMGDLDRAEAVVEAAPASVQKNFIQSLWQATLKLYRRDYDGARDVLLAAAPMEHSDRDHWNAEELLGDVEWAAGNRPQAQVHYQREVTLLEAALKQHPELALHYRGSLSRAYAHLGRTSEALAQAQLKVKETQTTKSVQREQYALLNLAEVQAQVGQVDQAIVSLDRLLATPAGGDISVPWLELDPRWDPIRRDPRFQALLKKFENTSQNPETSK